MLTTFFFFFFALRKALYIILKRRILERMVEIPLEDKNRRDSFAGKKIAEERGEDARRVVHNRTPLECSLFPRRLIVSPLSAPYCQEEYRATYTRCTYSTYCTTTRPGVEVLTTGSAHSVVPHWCRARTRHCSTRSSRIPPVIAVSNNALFLDILQQVNSF